MEKNLFPAHSKGFRRFVEQNILAVLLVIIAVIVTSYADIRRRQFILTSDVECEIKMLDHRIDDLYLRIDSLKQIQATI